MILLDNAIIREEEVAAIVKQEETFEISSKTSSVTDVIVFDIILRSGKTIPFRTKASEYNSLIQIMLET